MSGEAASRTSIGLPGVQTALVEAVAAAGRPLVLVLMNGRPLALEKESALADAILEAWYPGSEGGRAVADVLFGKRVPGGQTAGHLSPLPRADADLLQHEAFGAAVRCGETRGKICVAVPRLPE